MNSKVISRCAPEIGGHGQEFGHGIFGHFGHGFGHVLGHKDSDKLNPLTLNSDWGPTQPGVYDKLHRIYRDFDEIGHVIRQQYGVGPHIVAIIFMTWTKYDCNPGQKRN